MQTRSKSGITKPRIFTTNHPFPTALACIPTIPTPTTFAQASKNSKLLQAMQEEVSALHTTNIWTLVPPSPTHNAIGCKWVF